MIITDGSVLDLILRNIEICYLSKFSHLNGEKKIHLLQKISFNKTSHSYADDILGDEFYTGSLRDMIECCAWLCEYWN